MDEFTGYIANLDILGFSKLLRRETYLIDLKRYLGCIEEVVRSADLRIECIVFSDTIVLTSRDESTAAFSAVLRGTAAALHALLCEGIPVRGAIAFGRYIRDVQGGSVFLAGQPIVEAYEREKVQKWVGAIACSSVLYEQPGLSEVCRIPPPAADAVEVDRFDDHVDWALRLQPADIPVQDDGIVASLKGFAVVPACADASPYSVGVSLRGVLESLDDMRLKAETPELQSRYTRSIEWITDQQVKWEAFAETWKRHSTRARSCKE